MNCSNIIECLRNKNIEPEAFASSEWTSEFPASNAIKYDNSRFQTNAEKRPQFWGVYFKKKVLISSYQIVSDSVVSDFSNIYNWTFSISNNNKTFRTIHGPTQSTSTSKSYTFNRPYSAVYIRIDGDSLLSSDKTKIQFFYVKFFGSINAFYDHSCKTMRRSNNIFMHFIFLIAQRSI